MDKKTEIAMLKRRNASLAEEPAAKNVTATALMESAPLAVPPPSKASGWWMYHGDPEHTGSVQTAS